MHRVGRGKQFVSQDKGPVRQGLAEKSDFPAKSRGAAGDVARCPELQEDMLGKVGHKVCSRDRQAIADQGEDENRRF